MSLSSGRTRTSTGPAAAPGTVSRSPSSSSSNDQDDPFAPPPEGAPDRPWQPRTPPPVVHGGDQEGPGHGEGSGDGGGGQGSPGGGDRPGGAPPSPWSSSQPGRQDQGSGFGGQGGGGPGGGQGSRFDLRDPVQRRARYALLAGMWAFFFSLFSVPQIALLLGALALYWGISSLRGHPRATDSGGGGADRADRSAIVGTGQPGASGVKPQRAAAMSGIVAGGIALAMVLGLFVTQMVYRDYFDCVSDALTSKSRESCSELMPDWLRPWAGERG